MNRTLRTILLAGVIVLLFALGIVMGLALATPETRGARTVTQTVETTRDITREHTVRLPGKEVTRWHKAHCPPLPPTGGKQ